MRKCDGCRARVGAGLDPVCVAACPMRALEFGPVGRLRVRYGGLRDVAPLPASTFTKPNIVITPHPRSCSSGSRCGSLANAKEI